MTVGGWIDTHAAGAPAHLVAHVHAALGPDGEAPAGEATERCVAAAARTVDALLATGATARESALALLAADALVTFAFEAAADEPARLAERARVAMRQLSQG